MSKRLITDRDVLTGQVSDPIVLDGSTLITPSARDRAARMGLRIVEGTARESAAVTAGAATTGGGSEIQARCARCGSALAGGAASGGAAQGELADGLYLVRVEGGRWVSALPATGPGQMKRAVTRAVTRKRRS